VAVTGDAVTARVRNPLGAGTPAAPGTSGFGLAGLREQVGAQSGELVGGQEDGTWTVRCRLPIRSASPASSAVARA
jgi:glucose-6-phosphate-specific signal transduction histidine kinase